MTSPGCSPAEAGRRTALRCLDNETSLRTLFEVAGDHAVEALFESFDIDQAGDDLTGIIDRNCESDLLGTGPDRHVDADHLTHAVQQRAAAVPRVDRGIDLDQVLVRLFLVDFDIPRESADDPTGHRVLVSEGVADRQHVFAKHQVRRRAAGHHFELLARLDLDDRQVATAVERDHPGGVGRPVEQRHPQ